MKYKDMYPDYRIAYDGQHTYTVVYEPTQENISHHKTAYEARMTAKRYQEADACSWRR